MIEKTLSKIGLNNNEVKIYLMLLKEGSCLAGRIAEKTNIHRRTVYDALEKLMKKGLVTYTIKSGKKHFQSVNPERILLFLKEKEELIKKEEKEIKNIIPELKSLYKSSKTKIQAEIYSGKEGLKSVMELILKENKDWLSIGSTGKGTKILPYYLPGWHKKRLNLKIKYKGLIADTTEGKQRAEELSKIGLAEYKFLSKKIEQPQTIWIFGNKTAVILISIEQPIIFLIDNKEISNSFRNYFEWMWSNTKK